MSRRYERFESMSHRNACLQQVVVQAQSIAARITSFLPRASLTHTLALPVITYHINFRLKVINLHLNAKQRQDAEFWPCVTYKKLLSNPIMHKTFDNDFIQNIFTSSRGIEYAFRHRETHIVNVWLQHMFVITCADLTTY